MRKHTKGPWKAYQRREHERNTPWWQVIGEADNICVVSDSDGQPAESNAQLIAAAPGLLETCEQVLDNLSWNPADSANDLISYIRDAQDMLIKAIDKATA